MMTADKMRSLKLDETFVQLYQLTHEESEELKSALAAALHRYRAEEGRHLVPDTNTVGNPFASDGARIGIVLKE